MNIEALSEDHPLMQSVEQLIKMPGMDIVRACMQKDFQYLNETTNKNTIAFKAFAMGIHPRQGLESPVSLLSAWTLETIAHFTVHNPMMFT